jgi:protein involved in polysaccharide export with SLBB domain
MLAFVSAGVTLGQSINPVTQKPTLKSSSEPLMRNLPPTRLDPDKVALDRVIDPETYVLGPGDQLAISVLGAVAQTFPSVVTPDGQLLIPQVGAVPVAGRTLADARSAILNSVRRIFGDLPTAVVLTSVRQFRVFVGGEVVVPGAVRATPVERASDVILSAGWLTPDASERRIEIKRGRRTIPVDLLRFEKLGDLSANPEVEMGDVVVVPARLDSVAIMGQVANPEFYEWHPSDMVSTLIELAGGVPGDISSASAQIGHAGPGAVTHTLETLNLSRVISGESDPKVGRNDFIAVQSSSALRKPALVTVEGQLPRPGTYPIIDGVTRLRDVLDAAGGLTVGADIGGATVIRKVMAEWTDPDTARLGSVPRTAMTDLEYAYLKARVRRTGPVALRGFRSVMSDPPPDVANIVLKDGDRIVVPTQVTGVEVIGQVTSPGIVAYDQSLDWGGYVELAGGTAWNADTRHARVIKRNTGVWLKAGSATIEPGDVVFVPEDEEIDWWILMKDILNVVGQLATTLILVRSL